MTRRTPARIEPAGRAGDHAGWMAECVGDVDQTRLSIEQRGLSPTEVRVLLHLETAPTPFDASDALAAAICHVHATGGAVALPADAQRLPRSWRQWRPPAGSRPS